MLLNQGNISSTGTLKELVGFENRIHSENKLANERFADEKTEAARMAKLREEMRIREARRVLRFKVIGISTLIILAIIFVVAFFKSCSNDQSTNTISPQVQPSYQTYYVKSKQAALMSAVHNGRRIARLFRGTAVSVMGTDDDFYKVNYNGTIAYIKATKLSSQQPVYQEQQTTQTAAKPVSNPAPPQPNATSVQITEWITCPSCNGSGRIQGEIPCTWCDGRGSQSCTGCWGRGYHDCTYCWGHGFVEHFDRTRATCTNCNGSGKVTCSICNGAKTVSCKYCSGTGKKTGEKVCDQCKGAGKVEKTV